MRLLLSILILMSLVACGEPGGDEAAVAVDADAPIKVVVTVPPLAWAVEAVWGDRAEVTVLMPEGASPHGWEPTASDVLAIHSADLLVYVDGHQRARSLGIERDSLLRLGMQLWNISMLTHAVGFKPPEGYDPQPFDCGASFAELWEMPRDVHPWLVPAKVQEYAMFLSYFNITEVPGHDAIAAEMVARVAGPAIDRIDAVRQSVSAAGVLVITGHDAWPNFFYGIDGEDVLSLRHDHHDEPTAGDLADISMRAATAERVLVVLDPHEDEPWLRRLAEDVGAVTVTLDPVGSRDWHGDMIARYKAVAAALESLE